MSKADVDEYLAGVQQPQQVTLQTLREMILAELPDAEECISYGVPTYKVNGSSIAGFAAYKNHCSYFPMSGSVLAALADDPELAGYQMSKGTLRFKVDEPLPHSLVHKLIRERIAQV